MTKHSQSPWSVTIATPCDEDLIRTLKARFRQGDRTPEVVRTLNLVRRVGGETSVLEDLVCERDELRKELDALKNRHKACSTTSRRGGTA